MEIVQVKDKRFALSIPEATILAAIDQVAARMNRDLAEKNPIFVAILNGSFMFASDLMKRITIPSEISFVKLASYHGTQSSNVVSELIGLNVEVANRTVVVIEDIVDSGQTMKQLTGILAARQVKELYISTLLFKPEALRCDVHLDYVAMEIPNDFIVGFGLDYDGYGRNLRHIYTLIEE
jgi:hypoxanthine phosphoribosyltransferase